MKPTFSLHLEWPHHAITSPVTWPRTDARAYSETLTLLGLLQKYEVKATVYVLGHVAEQHPELMERLVRDGHRLGSHGYLHQHGEQEGDRSDQLARRYIPNCEGYCSPYWDTTPRTGLNGGVFFRILPYWLLKREVERTGLFYLHPHDLYAQKVGYFPRRLMFCDPWERLERLVSEVAWHG